MNTRTIYVSQTETRTFEVGELVSYYIGQQRYDARIVGFPNGLFEVRIAGKNYTMLGAVFAKALKPWRIPTEQLAHSY